MADTKDFLAGVTLTDAAAAKAKALILSMRKAGMTLYCV